MNMLFEVLTYIFGALFIVGMFGTIIVLMVALFRATRQLHQTMIRHNSTMVSLAKAQAEQLRLQNLIMNRYEQNIANWYNAQTGDVWKMDQKLKDHATDTRDRIEQLVAIIENDQSKLKP